MNRLITTLVTVCAFALLVQPASAAKELFKAKGDTSSRPEVTDLSKVGALDCSGAVSVSLGTTVSGDTNTGVNNVTTYSCSFYDESGPELVYILDLPNPTMFTIDLVPEAGVDLDLAVLDQCDEDLGCIIVSDAGIVTNSPVQGTFYLVVDGYAGAAGTFDLILTEEDLPEPADACDQVQQPIPGNEGDVFTGVVNISGDTCGAGNDLEFLDCADYSEAGQDDWYELVLLPGALLEINVTNAADGALWLVDACSEPLNCVAYADATLSGEAENIVYTNETGSNQVVYLVVDSYGVDSCGAYTGTITVNPPGVIDNDADSFGSMKARF